MVIFFWYPLEQNVQHVGYMFVVAGLLWFVIHMAGGWGNEEEEEQKEEEEEECGKWATGEQSMLFKITATLPCIDVTCKTVLGKQQKNFMRLRYYAVLCRCK